MSLMGNVIKTVRSTGSDYWAAYVGGEKIKTDGLKQLMLLPINDLSYLKLQLKLCQDKKSWFFLWIRKKKSTYSIQRKLTLYFGNL